MNTDRIIAIIAPVGYMLAGAILRELGEALIALSEIITKGNL